MRSNETYSSTPKTCSQRGQGRPASGCGSWSRAARGHARLAVGCGSHSHATHGHMRLVGRGSWSGTAHSHMQSGAAQRHMRLGSCAARSQACLTVGRVSRSGRRSSPSPTAPIDGLGPHRRPRLTDPRGSQTPDSQPAAFPTSTAHRAPSPTNPPSCVRLSDHDLGLINVDAAHGWDLGRLGWWGRPFELRQLGHGGEPADE